MLRHVWLGTLAALTLTTIGLAADAAPAGTVAASLSAFKGTSAEPVARRCWWYRGVRHCRRYSGFRVYGYSGPHYPEAYRTGSSRWWQEMDRQDRGGRGGRR